VEAGPLIVEDPRLHSVRHTTLGKTPLDESSARRRDPYLTTHNTLRETDFHAPDVGHCILKCVFMYVRMCRYVLT